MEIILKEDIEKLGFKDDIVTVKPGYGRNYLIPRGLAILATPSAKKVLAENLKQRAHREKQIVEEANKLAKDLLKLEVKIFAKTGTGDKLFGSINSGDISAFLEKAGQAIDKKFISVPGGNVKRIGKYEASVRLHRDVIISLPFEVLAEESTKKQQPAKEEAPVPAEAKADE